MKKILLLLFFSISTHLHSSQHLVIGSIREKDDTLPDFLKKLWQEDKADFTYPKKITLDLKKTNHECLLHIVDDATKRSFPPACFTSIYIERLPTSLIYTEFIEYSGTSIPVGRVKFPLNLTIFNTKKALADNGRLAIEWFASCSLNMKTIAQMQYTQDELFSDEVFPFCKNELEQQFNIQHELENLPFHCFIYKSLLYITLYNVVHKNPNKIFSISPEILINGLKNNCAKNKIPGPLKKKFFTFCKERNFFFI